MSESPAQIDMIAELKSAIAAAPQDIENELSKTRGKLTPDEVEELEPRVNMLLGEIKRFRKDAREKGLERVEVDTEGKAGLMKMLNIFTEPTSLN